LSDNGLVQSNVWSSANFFPWIYIHSDINNIPWSKKESAAVHDFKPEHAENFRAFLDLIDWENVDKSIASCHHMPPLLHKNLASCTIQDFLSELYNLGILKPFTIPWLTINGLLKSIRTKAKLFKKFLNNSNSYHENVYKAVQNKLIYLIKDAKRKKLLTGEKITGSCKFSTRLPFSVRLLFCLFQA